MIPWEYFRLPWIKQDEMQLAHQVQWVASVGGLDVQNGYVSKMQTWINAYVCACCVQVLCSAACNTQIVQCCAVQRAVQRACA